MDYAILDIETTGGKFNEEGIIEIAVYRFNGEKVTDTFISMVNPERKIHFYVQKLTGITSKMVLAAPKFYELAKRLIEITENAIIVAHNANFDYRVIKNEFKRLGYNYQRLTLDTVNLSKKLIPNMPSYSLGNLCSELGIPVSDRHRAHGDARATVQLFQLLLAKDINKNIITSFIQEETSNKKEENNKINKLLESLPQLPGVFYLLDANGTIIYLASSRNISIKARLILTHNHRKSKIILKQTVSINYELTGSAVIAEIKALNEEIAILPKFKATKENYPFLQGIFIKGDQFTIAPITHKNKKSAWLAFSTVEEAESFLENFTYTETSKNNYFLKEDNLLLLGIGRNKNEHSFLYLEKGLLKGYGYYKLHSQIKSVERIQKIMIPATANLNLQLLIRNLVYINKKLIKKVITLE